ncbi:MULTISPECIES: hypothetical protein [Sphingobium]|uniref:PRC-barrel domain-containing protein n=1 Tax=Sphingobium fuliginis ATCC 27551 TaxID=1208342 RepID=A0A5B8CML1_SPHSA|nr:MULTISPECIES: hypothetical protein [Sphingobium]PNP99868.1 hypothetical protein A8G00_18310 [Sphingobium sp. SA916]QDC39883.1 hypothetical protein FIL70_22255 [Sphingobium fuliginis ATCC 27551]
MKYIFALAAALSLSSPAATQDAPVIKARTMVKTADGVRVGFIDRVNANAEGAPTSVQIIYKGRFVSIPAATLSNGEKGLVTSLTAADLNKL